MPAVADIGHAVQFHREKAELWDTVATFLADGIRDGGVSIAIATEAHRRAIDDALVAVGVDPVAARREGQLLSFDAETTLAHIMKRGRLDRAAFRRTAAALVPGDCQTRRPARVFGEMASLLWDAGDVIAAIELETLCNELRRQVGFSMLCTYHGEALHDESHADALSAVCRLHSARSPFSVLARSDQQVIRISVSDASDAMPELRAVGPGEGPGIGLQMVAALAGAWGVEVTAGGKSVWAQLAVRS